MATDRTRPPGNRTTRLTTTRFYTLIRDGQVLLGPGSASTTRSAGSRRATPDSRSTGSASPIPRSILDSPSPRRQAVSSARAWVNAHHAPTCRSSLTPSVPRLERRGWGPRRTLRTSLCLTHGVARRDGESVFIVFLPLRLR